MDATRPLMWLLGILFVLGGSYLLYFEAGLSRWFSLGVLTAGFLLFIGLAVMAFFGSGKGDAPVVVRHENVVAVPPTTTRPDERRAP